MTQRHPGSSSIAAGGQTASEVRVELGGGARSYSVLVGQGVLDQLGPVVRGGLPAASRVLLIVDSGVPAALVGQAVGSLASCGVSPIIETVRPSEEHKSFETAAQLLETATRHKVERGEPVIALGGGIVGDLAGFVAGIYRRGVPFYQCPTTLLAMVDASVGGKTGINVRMTGGGLRKNMAGVFWQPRGVLCDVGALSSLPEDELCSGLAECVKHGLIGADWGDAALGDWMEANAEGIRRRQSDVLAELIVRNVAIKARVVEADEREESTDQNGGRMALNAGHTIGHALEALAAGAGQHASAGGRTLKHGQAVALGLIAEARIGVLAGITCADLPDRLVRLFTALGLLTRAPFAATPEQVLAVMGDDKKVTRSELRCVVPDGHGHGRVISPVDPGDVVRALSDTILAAD